MEGYEEGDLRSRLSRNHEDHDDDEFSMSSYDGEQGDSLVIKPPQAVIQRREKKRDRRERHRHKAERHKEKHKSREHRSGHEERRREHRRHRERDVDRREERRHEKHRDRASKHGRLPGELKAKLKKDQKLMEREQERRRERMRERDELMIDEREIHEMRHISSRGSHNQMLYHRERRNDERFYLNPNNQAGLQLSPREKAERDKRMERFLQAEKQKELSQREADMRRQKREEERRMEELRQRAEASMLRHRRAISPSFQLLTSKRRKQANLPFDVPETVELISDDDEKPSPLIQKGDEDEYEEEHMEDEEEDGDMEEEVDDAGHEEADKSPLHQNSNESSSGSDASEGKPYATYPFLKLLESSTRMVTIGDYRKNFHSKISMREIPKTKALKNQLYCMEWMRRTNIKSESSSDSSSDEEEDEDDDAERKDTHEGSEVEIKEEKDDAHSDGKYSEGSPSETNSDTTSGHSSEANSDDEEKTNEEEKEASPVEVKEELPPYYPAIMGCRSVDEFECLNRIEEGTYGVVYRAREKSSDEIVALKRLKMEKEKEGFPITSLREVNTLLKSQHLNIVTVREIVVGSNMDKIYIVMDYVEHDLKSLMETMKQKKQVFTIGEVKTLMIQLLRAVHHLHDNWILHRDLKTSNLLLSHRGILKVGDFGLAREYGSPLKQYTPIVVTLWYRAPELLLGTKEYSCPIDVWSVGCIFGELLGMEPMFPGKSEIDQLNKIFKDLGTPTEKIWPGYSQLPVVKKTQFAEYPYNHLKERFKTRLSEQGFELLNNFLTYNPTKRITCYEGMDHAYFHTEPPSPIDPAMFPTWPAKSENPHGKPKKTGVSPKPPSGGKIYKELVVEDENIAGFFLGGAPSSGPGFTLKF